MNVNLFTTLKTEFKASYQKIGKLKLPTASQTSLILDILSQQDLNVSQKNSLHVKTDQYQTRTLQWQHDTFKYYVQKISCLLTPMLQHITSETFSASALHKFIGYYTAFPKNCVSAPYS